MQDHYMKVHSVCIGIGQNYACHDTDDGCS